MLCIRALCKALPTCWRIGIAGSIYDPYCRPLPPYYLVSCSSIYLACACDRDWPLPEFREKTSKKYQNFFAENETSNYEEKYDDPTLERKIPTLQLGSEKYLNASPSPPTSATSAVIRALYVLYSKKIQETTKMRAHTPHTHTKCVHVTRRRLEAREIGVLRAK